MYKLSIDPAKKVGHINPEIQGHFSEHLGRCIYEGLYVGEDSDIPNTNGMRNDVVAALKDMKIPVLRWPGGCFADEYHWKDGIGPKESRKKMINTNWGGVIEDNSFGTHEFMELCKQVGCKTYVNGNVGSGTVQEMSEWVEYMTFDGESPMANLRKANGHEEPFKVDYFCVGNESWGCGGNMRPAYYADQYRRYQSFIKNYQGDEPIAKLAVGPNSGDYKWTEEFFESFKDFNQKPDSFLKGFTLHHYTIPSGQWEKKGSATEFDDELYYSAMKNGLFMDELITKHGAIMDKYDPEKKIGLMVDEWGGWYDVEPGTNPGFLYQQSTMRDAILAAINLNIFNKHCDRVRMANIAQLINVLQAVILTDGAKMILTPTYYAFKMFSAHQDADLVESSINTELVGTEKTKIPNLSESVSIKDGKVIITLVNLALNENYDIEADMKDTAIKGVKASILTNEVHAHNTFEKPDTVKTVDFTDIKAAAGKLNFTVPACSVLEIEVEI